MRQEVDTSGISRRCRTRARLRSAWTCAALPRYGRRPMKLGLMLGYWMFGPEDPIDLVLEAERSGFDSVWTAEAYGSDAVSYLSWMGARTTRIKLGTGIIQLSARTPACVAMTAMTID